ncbi:hypothetical protein DL766_002169 [Monosporascus sp. MC13-8B]|uniref:Lariat debranching enzyme C-terminal domain-containing protein n=1 Tax=Monosporascus cannonballus TaxID=155416 RepID=A0ABY0HHI2_9PEZI|nr:hypothetical protein DL762_001179 [Monosporascus cannonballus]RYP36120.1 hypothetical protein DL766_002169 [Monosporascus sp. MC13-8B]
METKTHEADGVRIAVEGCGHGTLDAIYASVAASSKARGWDGVELLIIGGDFQAVRNAADLSVMAVPPKYRQLGDFPAYYSGEKKAPYLTIFLAGNHEASSHLWELYYGGWVAPNIYYMGAANVLRLGPLRIAGLGGIWKGYDYRKPHHERLPFSQDDIKSFYHVREFDTRKLLLLREQVDIGISHDWPRGIENHGNSRALWKMKPDFRQESIDGKLGNPAAEYVMNRLRPAYWFSAHLHCKFAAVKEYDAPVAQDEPIASTSNSKDAEASKVAVPTANPDEIDLDMDESEDEPSTGVAAGAMETAAPSNPEFVSDDIRAQLPASFAKSTEQPKLSPGQPVPPTITNTTTRFLSLDKCLPGRKFLQLCTVSPVDSTQTVTYPPSNSRQRYHLRYDPEWLAITRVFAQYLTIGDREAQTPPDLGENVYSPMIDRERIWVEDNIVQKGRLDIPKNFTITAPPHRRGDPENVNHQPDEYTNPQTVAFCELVGVPNLWDASSEERAERKAKGPPETEPRVKQGGSSGREGSYRGGSASSGPVPAQELDAAAASPVAAAKDRRTFAVLRFHNEGGHFSTEGRMDPIVYPGTVSSHSHGVMGGSNFGLRIEGDQLLDSECTNALLSADKSNYWVPALFFQSPINGTFKRVPLFYMQVYYFFEPTNDEIKPFPPGLKIVSGDAMTRTAPASGALNLDPGRGPIQAVQFTCPTRDPGAVRYPPDSDGTRAGLQDPTNRGAGAGFPVVDCDGYASPLRQDVHLPSCYDPRAGPDAHATNMAFPRDAGGGKQDCPPGWVHVPHLFLEVYWDTPRFAGAWDPDGRAQPFVLANGDRTGFSSHGDFVAGWDEGTLAAIIDGCDAGNGGMDRCPETGPLNPGDWCRIPPVFPDPQQEWLDDLPGDNPVSGWGV